MSDAYQPHRQFIAVAARQMGWGRMVAVFLTYLVVFTGTPVLLYLLLPPALSMQFNAMSFTFATLAHFAIFGVTAVALLRAVHHFHRRGLWSLIGPYRTALWDLRKVALGVGIVLLFVQIILPFGTWGAVERVRPILLWLALLPLALMVIFVQIATEELLFRGYLQQQLACLSSSPWVWMILPSTVFGAWHYWNGNSAPEGFVYAVWAFMLGVACADLTARTGTLGAALGLHFAVNVVAVVFVGITGWPLTGVALVLFPAIDPDVISAEIIALGQPWVVFNLMTSALSVLIMWLAARIALQR